MLRETLALASLLEVDSKDTWTETQGLLLPATRIDSESSAAVAETNEEKDQRMRKFWTTFNERWPDLIPPWAIFLPGERVQLRGFGWSPRTWRSAHEDDIPDPLSLVNSTAKLDIPPEGKLPRGLRVRYPGFLLYPPNREALFSTDKLSSELFRFRIDLGLEGQERYKVKSADIKSSKLFLEEARSGNKQLAIILSRWHTQKSVAEIGLLVQIYGQSDDVGPTAYRNRFQDSLDRHSQNETNGKVALHCEILHRVRVSRGPGSSKNHGGRNEILIPRRMRYKWSSPFKVPITDGAAVKTMLSIVDEKMCTGEILSDQTWFVDGFFGNGTRPLSPAERASTPNPGFQKTGERVTDRAGKNPEDFQLVESDVESDSRIAQEEKSVETMTGSAPEIDRNDSFALPWPGQEDLECTSSIFTDDEEKDPAIVKFYKWINDAIWPLPNVDGARRVWYLCVSRPPYQENNQKR